MKQLLKSTLRTVGYDVVRYHPKGNSQDQSKPNLAAMLDLTTEQKRILTDVHPYTMTSVENRVALLNAVTYITQNAIPGDIAECGVWRGGSMMTVALTLLSLGDRSRSLYLYDTYEGMSPPAPVDKNINGVPAIDQLEHDRPGTGVWCYAGLDDVRANIHSTGYPKEKIHLIRGKVEDTLPGTLPAGLAILRLDTDWYESTKHELTHLYPLLHENGILILDDYGHWQGAKKAVDEYFAENAIHVYMHRIDYTARILVKPESQQ